MAAFNQRTACGGSVKMNALAGLGVPRDAETCDPLRMNKNARLVLIVILILLLLGMLPTWPYSAGWGYYPSGGLGLVLLILIILLVLGKI